MKRAERVEIMKDVRSAVSDIITAVFDSVDEDIIEFTYTENNVKLIRASNMRQIVKALRSETVTCIRQRGKEDEGDDDEL